MSIRSLIEINHDFTPYLEGGFLVRLKDYLNSGDSRSADVLTAYGVQLLSQRHHSSEYRLEPHAPGFPPPPSPHVFLDCDGVLADFDEAGRILFGEEPRAYEARVGSRRFWQELEDRGDFYRTLPLMADAMQLYEGVKHLNPTILTGCPRGNWAESQKVDWAARHFPGVPIITCRSSDKRAHAKPGDVLIDDWPQHRHRWIEHGGVFISHFDAETSLAALWAHYPNLHPDQQVAA